MESLAELKQRRKDLDGLIDEARTKEVNAAVERMIETYGLTRSDYFPEETSRS